MRIAILDDVHRAYEGTTGVSRLRDRAEVQIFTGPFGEPAALRGFDAVVANRERTRFTRELLQQLPNLQIIAQTGNHAYHIDLAAAEERKIIVAKAAGGFCRSAAELAHAIQRFLAKMNDKEDPELKLPPVVEEALTKLTELFSDPSLPSKARLRCPVEGPDEFDVLFESIIDDQFGHDPNSEYKQWVRRLYELGLISSIPSDWEVADRDCT